MKRFNVKRLFATALSAAMILTMCPAAVYAEEAEGSQEADTVYVLMNIPYSDFYAAEGDSDVDVVTSATKGKTLTGTGLAKGSYHVNSDGSDITGITYPVKLTSNDLEIVQEKGGTEVTDESSISITSTNRGQESTQTYEGKDALFEASSYSYYVLDETPAYYKELTVSEVTQREGTSKVLSFSASNAETETIAPTDYSFTTETGYGDYQLNVETTAFDFNSDTVYGVVVNTTDGDAYGLRHIENIWRGTELAWSTGHTTNVHGCTLSYTDYEDMEGKSIASVTYYTSNGNFVLTLEAQPYVAPYYPLETVLSADAKSVMVAGIPSDIQNAKADVYYTTGEGRNITTNYVVEDADITDGAIALGDAVLDSATTYTVKITSDNYATLTSTVLVADTLYLEMNIPYADFYAAEGVTADQQVDVVSTATTNKFKGTTGLAKGTYNDGTNISGVTYPVQVSLDTYTAIRNRAAGGDYDFTILSEAPSAYKELTVADGKYQFGKTVATEKDVTGITVEDFTTNSAYGNYQITLNGVLTTGGCTINDETAVIAGCIFETSDGMTYPMYMLENVWLGTKVPNLEIAWSVKNAPAVYKAHGSGDPFFQYDMNGKTLTSVKLITDIGTYTIACDQKLTPFYASFEAVASEDGKSVNVSGLPSDIVNPVATVSYTVGEGREAQTTYVAEDAAVVNGVVALSTELADENTYKISIKSDNYGEVSVNVKKASTVTLKAKTVSYTGKTVKIDAAVVTGSTGAVSYQYYKDSACKTKVSSVKNAGTYYVKATVAADDNYGAATSNAVKLVVKQVSNKITSVTSSKKISYKKLAKKNQTFKMTAKRLASAKLTYKKASGNSKIAISSTGKVTVKKGLKKGTYKVKVKVTAAKTTNYKATSVTKVMKIIVK